MGGQWILVISSVLAHYQMLAFVMIATAAATGVTSWAEFSEDARKVERYSSAVNGLKKLLNWWDSLGEVEKASRESIAHLVLEAEAIISQEQRSWTSTASKPGAIKEGDAQQQEVSGMEEAKAIGAVL